MPPRTPRIPYTTQGLKPLVRWALWDRNVPVFVEPSTYQFFLLPDPTDPDKILCATSADALYEKAQDWTARETPKRVWQKVLYVNNSYKGYEVNVAEVSRHPVLGWASRGVNTNSYGFSHYTPCIPWTERAEILLKKAAAQATLEQQRLTTAEGLASIVGCAPVPATPVTAPRPGEKPPRTKRFKNLEMD